MLQWAVVDLVVLACAVHVARTLLPAAWQRGWRARIGLVPRHAAKGRKGIDDCGSCSGCAGPPAVAAGQERKVIRVVPRR